MTTFTQLRALADLADQNVETTARLVDAGVLTQDDMRDACREALDAHGIALPPETMMASHPGTHDDFNEAQWYATEDSFSVILGDES